MNTGFISSLAAVIALALTVAAAPDAAASKEKFERDKPHIAVDAAAVDPAADEKHAGHDRHAGEGGCCQKHREQHDREHGCKMMADGNKGPGCKMMADGNKGAGCKKMAEGKKAMAAGDKTSGCPKMRGKAEEQDDQPADDATE